MKRIEEVKVQDCGDYKVLHLNLEKRTLVSLTAYSTTINLSVHDFTPADARAMIKALSELAYGGA